MPFGCKQGKSLPSTTTKGVQSEPRSDLGSEPQLDEIKTKITIAKYAIQLSNLIDGGLGALRGKAKERAAYRSVEGRDASLEGWPTTRRIRTSLIAPSRASC
eukprot:1139702-Pelagomonas_calceolata.AAC.4